MPKQIPKKVLALRDESGDKTPAIREWCKKNWKKDEYETRYGKF